VLTNCPGLGDNLEPFIPVGLRVHAPERASGRGKWLLFLAADMNIRQMAELRKKNFVSPTQNAEVATQNANEARNG
jgi:hypothetical protein